MAQARAGWRAGLGLTPIRAAGGVPVRRTSGEPEVLLVHRPRYDDWSFPKGKAHRGETDEDCAVREVEEETGLVCELDDELPATNYTVGGRPKRVRYWIMARCAGELSLQAEVDEGKWVPLVRARELLSYEHDRELLDAVGERL